MRFKICQFYPKAKEEKTHDKVMNEFDNMNIRKRRIFNVFFSALIFLGTEISIFYNPQIAYVPAIINGFITAMSILIAVAVFSFSVIYPRVGELMKRKYLNFAFNHLNYLFVTLIMGISLGYSFVLNNQLFSAFSWFLLCFMIMTVIIVDIWAVNEKFLL